MSKLYINKIDNSIQIDTCYSVFNRLDNSRDYRFKSIISKLPQQAQISPKIEKMIYETAAKKSKVSSKIFQKIYTAYEKNKHPSQLASKASSTLCSSDINHLKKMMDHIDTSSTLGSFFQETFNHYYIQTFLQKHNIQISNKLILKHTKEIKFLIESHILLNIELLKNSTEKGQGVHQLHYNHKDQILSIRVNGKLQSVKTLMGTFKIDHHDHSVYRKINGKKEYWSYVNENGLSPIDRYMRYEKIDSIKNSQTPHLVPIATLTSQEVQKLHNHAKSNSTFSKGKTQNKDCYIQIMANPEDNGNGVINEAINPFLPSHVGFRIILKEKGVYKVYSSGVASTKYQRKERDKGLRKFLITHNAQPTIIDQDEAKVSKGRIVTTVPVTLDKAQEILEIVNNYRKRSIRFNFAKQNCVKLTANILEHAGIKVNVDMRISKIIKNIIFGQKKIYAGRPFKAKKQFSELSTKNKIKTIARIIFNMILAPLYITVEILLHIASFIGMHCIGGGLGTPKIDTTPLKNSKTYSKKMKNKMLNLQTLTSYMKNFFNPNWSKISYTNALIRWQLAQSNTYIHGYTRPRLCIIPNEKFGSKKIDTKARSRIYQIFNVR